MIDLQMFCAKEDSGRNELQKPWSRDGATFATNDHIVVRLIPPREDIGDFDLAPDAAKVMEKFNIGDAVFRPVNAVTLPDLEKGDCEHCNGRGTEHDCPDCTCKCDECLGEGLVMVESSVMISGKIVSLDYAKRMITLPGLLVATEGVGAGLPFRFDGGDGVVMCLSGRRKSHFDVEL